ncbi:DUF2512 family protein [Bacillus coahuilensis]|uniref:DUF2512 family protein n=1 Tax=Bacillus coahuilensis TaxID=408580 RepID=UPI0001850ECE|nr:DUF2512 family protein [Bacillus coahuilensis]
MNTLRLLSLKFVLSLVVYAISLDLFFEASLAQVVSFSVLSTILTYLTGIVILLKRLGSNSTLIVHFFTVYSIIWYFWRYIT